MAAHTLKGKQHTVLHKPIHCVKFSASNSDQLQYNGSQDANGLD